ncbi:response regulator [Flavobacterium sp. TP390]|uniref:Response regulator n=1 Tax=Flavobacterium profundi TaxID=1774945 RepID=A0A6I4ILY5_9FLAO|nr:LytTR family DNA-binding domain-containing protein [Flavobacterium profundi]MVO09839.1 response regulator [Flavobacterium profundi]
MKAIIIDDEAKSRRLIQIMIQENCTEIESVFEASDLESGVALIKKEQPQLVFLDIEMPKYSGLQIVDFFQPYEMTFEIIFITAYNEYALQAFKLAAIDYLLKPVDKSEFIQAVRKAKVSLENEKVNQNLEELKKAFQQLSLNKMALEVPKGVRFVSHDDILLFEADGMYTKVYLKDNQTELICKPLKHFVDQLQQKAIFYKPHRSYLINLKYLKELSKNDGFYLVMENHKSIPLSKEKKEEFMNLINDVF